jgi:hypothetical protein
MRERAAYTAVTAQAYVAVQLTSGKRNALVEEIGWQKGFRTVETIVVDFGSTDKQSNSQNNLERKS